MLKPRGDEKMVEVQSGWVPARGGAFVVGCVLCFREGRSSQRGCRWSSSVNGELSEM